MDKHQSNQHPTTRIMVVRHGQSEGNRRARFGGHGPTPLSALGAQQARETGAAIAKLEATAIVSSDLIRAEQTAAAIADVTGLPCATDPGLRERSLGIFDGQAIQDVKRDYPDDWDHLLRGTPGYKPPDGEDADSVFGRVSTSLARILEQHRGGRIVLVSHGIAIYHLFAHICGLGSPGQGLQVFTMVENCSLSTFSYQRERWRIHALNDCAHLSERSPWASGQK